MRTTLMTLGLGLLLAGPALADAPKPDMPKSTAPVKSTAKVVKHHRKIADDAKPGEPAAKETPKKKKIVKKDKPAPKPVEKAPEGAPAK